MDRLSKTVLSLVLSAASSVFMEIFHKYLVRVTP